MTPFEVIPAIDLRGGRCVRLYQGDYARETVYSDDPAGTARRWADAGATRLHVVDLDGAAAGSQANIAAIAAIRGAVNVPIELGGGLRTLDALDAAYNLGIDRCVVGTAAIEDPHFFAEACRLFGPRLALGLDARDGYVATRGWKETTAQRAEDLAKEAARLGAGWLIVTDIARDGTLGGPNLITLLACRAASGLPVIASGGVSTLEHLRAARDSGAAGAIIGRAIYDGALDLAEAIRECQVVAC